MTQKCDIYSFGIVLLELLTGRPPVGRQASQNVLLVREFSPLLDECKLEELKVAPGFFAIEGRVGVRLPRFRVMLTQ